MSTATNSDTHATLDVVTTRRVVYLFGAGASHACAEICGSKTGILMYDLLQEIGKSIRTLTLEKYAGNESIQRLANDVISEDTDIEQVITFLEESGSRVHRTFSKDLRKVFRNVLNKRLEKIVTDLRRTSVNLYAAVIDMHDVPRFDEEIVGILTLNYDAFLECAIRDGLGRKVEYGINLKNPSNGDRAVRVLKLHGSFDWVDELPIKIGESNEDDPLWIPPGIQKAKGSYPFNILWGMARELLDCDVLRIVGCKLTANDWDLISMLFTTQYANSHKGPYDIEIINFPSEADEIKGRFPYLRAKSLLEIEHLGERMVSEVLGGAPRFYSELSKPEQKFAVAAMRSRNPFLYWLKIKAESMYEELGSVHTDAGVLERVMESY